METDRIWIGTERNGSNNGSTGNRVRSLPLRGSMQRFNLVIHNDSLMKLTAFLCNIFRESESAVKCLFQGRSWG